jgi:hypothetical protein
LSSLIQNISPKLNDNQSVVAIKGMNREKRRGFARRMVTSPHKADAK